MKKLKDIFVFIVLAAISACSLAMAVYTALISLPDEVPMFLTLTSWFFAGLAKYCYRIYRINNKYNKYE